MATARKPTLRVKCECCGQTFSTRTAQQRFCSPTCQKRAARGRKPAGDGELVKAVRAELTAAAKAETYAGQLAISLARQLSAEGTTGITGLSRELRAAMAEALGPKAQQPEPAAPAEAADEPEDEVGKARRERDEKLRSLAAGRA